MSSMNVKVGDVVKIVTGNKENKGKQGKVLVAYPDNNKVIVENLNLVKKHKKPRSAKEEGGIIDKPNAIDVSNVMVVCPKCGKTTRVAHILSSDGKKFVRSCKKCGAIIDVKVEKSAQKAVKATKTAKKSTKKTTASNEAEKAE